MEDRRDQGHLMTAPRSQHPPSRALCRLCHDRVHREESGEDQRRGRAICMRRAGGVTTEVDGVLLEQVQSEHYRARRPVRSLKASKLMKHRLRPSQPPPRPRLLLTTLPQPLKPRRLSTSLPRRSIPPSRPRSRPLPCPRRPGSLPKPLRSATRSPRAPSTTAGCHSPWTTRRRLAKAVTHGWGRTTRDQAPRS